MGKMTAAWAALNAQLDATKTRKILSLFEQDDRAAAYSAQLGDMLFDFSKTNINTDTLEALINLARTADVAAKRDAMFSGAPINDTEGRAVLHTALRNLDGGPVTVDGQEVMPGKGSAAGQQLDAGKGEERTQGRLNIAPGP